MILSICRSDEICRACVSKKLARLKLCKAEPYVDADGIDLGNDMVLINVQIEAWLDQTLTPRDVRRYELNDTTVGILTQLMNRNVLQDKTAELIMQDLQLKAEEYEAEGLQQRHEVCLVDCILIVHVFQY